jgi:hypothetical protein
MTDSSGNLSVDFLVGFTIFMVAFIWVATLVPNLFLGVSSHGIDFDAVAYRTGVILAEDPGATLPTVQTPWELQPDTANDNIARFGLALSKETPNILSEVKVMRFFNTTQFSYPDDYRKRTIFGDYPYRFNISLKDINESTTYYIGDLLPANYGFIRREVKIKHASNATIDLTDFQKFNGTNSQNQSWHQYSIVINTSELLRGNISDPVTNPNYRPAYQIDPRYDWINITIEDLGKAPPQPAWISTAGVTGKKINLSSVRFYQSQYGVSGLFDLPAGSVPHSNFTIDDLNLSTMQPVNPPFNIGDNVTLTFKPGFFSNAYDRGAVYVNLTFGVEVNTCDPPPPGCRYQGFQYVNNTRSDSRSGPWDYNYNATEVTQPYLTDAVLEVAVW